MVDARATGKRIHELANEHGYTGTRLSKELRVSENAVYKWFRGENLPTIDNLVFLRELFGVSIDSMIIGG